MARITIYHNPACGTSRNVLEILRNEGHEPEVIEYLKTPPSRERIREMVGAMGGSLRDILRQTTASRSSPWCRSRSSPRRRVSRST